MHAESMRYAKNLRYDFVTRSQQEKEQYRYENQAENSKSSSNDELKIVRWFGVKDIMDSSLDIPVATVETENYNSNDENESNDRDYVVEEVPSTKTVAKQPTSGRTWPK